jgi:hypothetical protein
VPDSVKQHAHAALEARPLLRLRISARGPADTEAVVNEVRIPNIFVRHPERFAEVLHILRGEKVRLVQRVRYLGPDSTHEKADEHRAQHVLLQIDLHVLIRRIREVLLVDLFNESFRVELQITFSNPLGREVRKTDFGYSCSKDRNYGYLPHAHVCGVNLPAVIECRAFYVGKVQ